MGEAKLQTRIKRGELRKSGDAWNCFVCPSPCSLGQEIDQHLRGAQHKHYLFVQSIKNPNEYQDVFSNLPLSIREAQRKGILRVQKEKVSCSACNVDLPGRDVLNIHLQSDRHQGKLKSKLPTTSSSKKVEGSSPRANLSQNSGAIAKAAKDLGGLQIHQPGPSFSSIQVSREKHSDQPTQPVSVSRRTEPEETALQAAIRSKHVEMLDDIIFRCILCSITTTGEEDMKQHLIGRKHKKKILSLIDVIDAPGASNQILSPLPIDRPNTAYEIRSSHPGTVLVFNYVFKGQNNVRRGAKKDEENIKEVFENMKYEVHIFTDYTKKNTMETFSAWIGTQKLENADSFIVFFLSHGGSTSADEFSTFDKEKISVHEIYLMLTNTMCPNLRGKPKLLFFNFCRGSTDQIHTDEDDCWKPGEKTEVPEDLAIVHASLPFIKAKRSPMTGTLFVKNLCKVLREQANLKALGMIIYEMGQLMRKENGTTPSLWTIHFKDFYFP